MKIPYLAVLMGANLIGNIRGLSKEGLRQEGFGLLTGALGAATGINVNGVVPNTFHSRTEEKVEVRIYY